MFLAWTPSETATVNSRRGAGDETCDVRWTRSNLRDFQLGQHV